MNVLKGAAIMLALLTAGALLIAYGWWLRGLTP